MSRELLGIACAVQWTFGDDYASVVLRERLGSAAALVRWDGGPAALTPPVGRLAWFSQPTRRIHWIAAAITAVMLVLAWWLVLATAGVQYATTHVMYLPVIVAALIFGVRGALVVAVIGGLAIGPVMPLDTATGEAQDPANWLQRMLFFCLIGALVGVGSGILRP